MNYDNCNTAVTFNNLHLKLLSTQGTDADKLLSTQRVNRYFAVNSVIIIHL